MNHAHKTNSRVGGYIENKSQENHKKEVGQPKLKPVLNSKQSKNERNSTLAQNGEDTSTSRLPGSQPPGGEEYSNNKKCQNKTNKPYAPFDLHFPQQNWLN